MSDIDAEDVDEIFERIKYKIEPWAKHRIETWMRGAERVTPDVDEKFKITAKLIKSLVDALIELAKRQGIEASLCEDDVKALKVLGVEA